MTEWSLGREMLSTMHEMQSIEDLEQWQALSSHVLDNVELLRVGIKRLASNSEKKESQVSRQIHVVPQTSTSDRSDNVKKMTELTLQNDILQAEVKALRSREEAQAQKLRQYENQNDQLTKRVEKQDFQIAAMEKQMKSSEEKYKKEFEDLSQSLGAMQQHKDMLKSLVQKLQDTQIPENVYVLRNEYDQQQRHLVELQCVQKGLEGRIRFYESKEDENAKTQSAQQQQLFACVAKEQQYEAHMTDLQRQIQSIKQELDCVKGMYMEECRKSEGLVNCVYTAERSVDEVKRQLATVTDMHKQATQRCEELRKEIHALWERNRSLLQSPPTQPVLSEEERLKDASAQGRGGENEEGMVEEEIEGGRQGRELNVRDGEDITGLHQSLIAATPIPTLHPPAPSYNLDETVCGKCRGDYTGIMLQCRGCKRKFHSHCAKQDFRLPGLPDAPCAIKDLGKGLCVQCFM